MKHIGIDTEALKEHFGKKVMELEEEKKIVQQESDPLLHEVKNLSVNIDGLAQKSQDVRGQKMKALEAQILDLKKKQENQVQLLKQKEKSKETAKKLQAEIQYIKAQKELVQLQHKMKQEAEQFRQWKASREKELLQAAVARSFCKVIYIYDQDIHVLIFSYFRLWHPTSLNFMQSVVNGNQSPVIVVTEGCQVNFLVGGGLL
ncbi:hypothetical protein HN51_015946, partial [Arachis hypogaea]